MPSMRRYSPDRCNQPCGGARFALTPDLAHESALWQEGVDAVAGLDEAGRGPLAGPVAAAAVVLEPYCSAPWLSEVRDSKLLSPAQRGALAPLIWRDARAAAVGLVSALTIDEVGILAATRMAMDRAVAGLVVRPQHLLIDALRLGSQPVAQTALIHGDARCASIACASVLAKVTRDRIMIDLAQRYPGYGFAQHKGYGTAVHRAALAVLGPCPIHRRSFGPVAAAIALR